MNEGSGVEAPREFVLSTQTVRIDDPFSDDDLILDLGGGGEGIIGRLRSRQVVALDIRRDELEESPPGPIKVIADARTLPFLDRSFDAATAFFFLMYVTREDRPAVLAEAHRILKPGGTLRIWDVTIPPHEGRSPSAFIVPVHVELPGASVNTGYGVRWDGREMSLESVVALAEAAGFSPVTQSRRGETFHIVLTKSEVA